MVKYNESIIYKLCCKDPNITDIYIGSTTNFTRRKCNHKNVCGNENDKKYNRKVYECIRENGNWDNWDMIQIEEINVDNKRELETRERYWIETLKSSLNINIPTQTYQEWCVKNREKISENLVLYRKDNKKKISEYQTEYYLNNKEYFSLKSIEYSKNNTEKIAKYKAEYYLNNKEYNKEKITCECGSEITKGSFTRHKKSKKHQKYFVHF